MRPRIESDTYHLVQGAFEALDCLRRGQLTGCSAAGQFPLFQTLPAMALGALGLGKDLILRLFAWSGLVMFGLSCLILHHVPARRDPWAGRLAVLIYLSGFVLCYSHSTYSEMGASFVTLAMVAACLEDARAGARPRLAAACLFFAALTKDTAAPLLLLLAAASTPRPRDLLPLGAAALAGIAASCGYNYFKFGSPINQAYLVPQFIVPTARLQASYFAGLWFSPTSGMWWMWPAFAMLFPVIALRLRGQPLPRARVWAGATLLMAAATLGFSRWCAPFGWVAWGPRLMLPWIPACLLLLAHEYAPELRAAAAGLSRRPRAAWAASAALGLSACMHFRVLIFRPYASLVLDSPLCEGVSMQTDVAAYHRCVQELTWPWASGHWPLTQVYALHPQPELLAVALVYGALIARSAHRLLASAEQRA